MNDLIDTINLNFQLEVFPNTEKIDKGFLSQNFKLVSKTGQKYFLKQHRHKEEQLIKQVMLAEEFFSSHQIPIVLPIEDKSKNKYFKFQDNFYSLYPYIEAISISRNNISAEALENMGAMLAKIHLAGKTADQQSFSKRSSNLKHSKFYTRYDAISNAIQEKGIKTEFDRMAHSILKAKLELSKSLIWQDSEMEIPYDHLIHGDFHDNNIFFDGQSNISHIFDLEKTEIAPRLYELVRSIDYVCFNSGYDQYTYDKALIYRDAYNSNYSINLNELSNALKAYIFAKIHDTWILHEHYINKNNRVDVFLPIHFQSIIYLKNNPNNWIERLST